MEGYLEGSFHLSVCPHAFLELDHWCFLNFWHGFRNLYKFVHDSQVFCKELFRPINWPNIGFFEFIENFGYFVLNFLYNESVYWLLYSCINPIFVKSLVSEI